MVFQSNTLNGLFWVITKHQWKLAKTGKAVFKLSEFYNKRMYRKKRRWLEDTPLSCKYRLYNIMYWNERTTNTKSRSQDRYSFHTTEPGSLWERLQKTHFVLNKFPYCVTSSNSVVNWGFFLPFCKVWLPQKICNISSVKWINSTYIICIKCFNPTMYKVITLKQWRRDWGQCGLGFVPHSRSADLLLMDLQADHMIVRISWLPVLAVCTAINHFNGYKRCKILHSRQ